jgi:ATP-dependent DNA helicase PIF1
VESLCSEVDRIARKYGRPSPTLRAAPTSVAACNFSGSTLYSMFCFGVKDKPLALLHLKMLQAKFKDVVYLIIDEKSISGC